MYPRNASTPPRMSIGQVIQAADGAVQTTGVAVFVRTQSGDETPGQGELDVGASGIWYYRPNAAETNASLFTIVLSKAGCYSIARDVAPTGTTVAGTVYVHTNGDKAGYSLVSGPLDAAGTRAAVGLASANLDAQLGALPTASITAAAVWDRPRNSHTTAGTFGESLQPATGQITSATASTVTLPSPYDTGRAKDREIVIGNQARTLGTHVAGGEYQLNRNWDSTPPDGSDYWLGGVGELGSASAPTASEVAGAVWDRPRNSHTTAGTFGHGVASVQGPVTGSVGSVTGSVGSVAGNVGGSVLGAVGSVAGNVGGSVGSVVGSVGSVVGNIGGSVASVTGNVGGNVVGSVASVTAGVTVADKTGFKLASDGLDVIPVTPPTGRANTLPKQIAQIWGSRFNKAVHDRDAGTITYYANDGTTVILNQTATDTGTVETQGAAS